MTVTSAPVAARRRQPLPPPPPVAPLLDQPLAPTAQQVDRRHDYQRPNRTRSSAMNATTVLPAPVGSTTTPRPSFASQLRKRLALVRPRLERQRRAAVGRREALELVVERLDRQVEGVQHLLGIGIAVVREGHE